MPSLRRPFLVLYMMRVPLLFLAILGFGLPWAFQNSMFHGVADLALPQVLTAACVAYVFISIAITDAFLVLLYGVERADGWADPASPQQHVSTWSVVLLYLYGGLCYILFLYSIYAFMLTAMRVSGPLLLPFLLRAFLGFLLGLAITLGFFLAFLRWARLEDDNAVEVIAFPLFYVFRKFFGCAWIRSLKKRSSRPQGVFSRLLARLGPGYSTQPAPGHPAVLHSGHLLALLIMFFFLVAYWVSGWGTGRALGDLRQWSPGGAPNTVLGYLLLLLIFWSSLLSGLTFLVDRFRFPALIALAAILYAFSFTGNSDHVFSTIPLANKTPLPRPEEAFEKAPETVIVVAAAGGGIQSAAWTSRVLCGLRNDLQKESFDKRVLAISGVSGGSVGTMFYLRCLEGAEADERPATWAQGSSLEAVAWGLTHPDLRRIFIPGPETRWSHADRGWALERSLLKSAHFEKTERRLADSHPDWPILLLNSTDAPTGDPVVFSNGQFPTSSTHRLSNNHYFRSFHQMYPGEDVLLETAVRMSAAFPYVSPEARPEKPDNGVHLGDGGYFDNSGIFALSEWLKEAVEAQAADTKRPKKRILILQLDAFPDSATKDQEPPKKWYYQIGSPLNTMLKVRSEAQIVRDETAGKDLQRLLYGSNYETSWLLVRYTPNARGKSVAATETQTTLQCSPDPPLSWHLTVLEQDCIDQAWTKVRGKTADAIRQFLTASPSSTVGQCDTQEHRIAPGIFERSCPAAPAHEHAVTNAAPASPNSGQSHSTF